MKHSADTHWKTELGIGRWVLGAVLLLGSGLGCGTAELSEAQPHGQQAQELLATNRLATNRLATNRLATNRLATNGLATVGLSSTDFATWFEENPEDSNELMKYLLTCALPEGETRSFTLASTSETYTWTGSLGLAPSWGSGEPATEQEEQLVSACLAAHANPYEVPVVFSVLGRNAAGDELPSTPEELTDYSQHEACFFGNVFRDEGLYAGNDRAWLSEADSSLRGCGLSSISSGTNPICAPILRVGMCQSSLCTLSASGLYYEECTYNGVVYRPVTTRIAPATLYSCGDGTCQVTEHCGTGETADNCGLDCGACQ